MKCQLKKKENKMEIDNFDIIREHLDFVDSKLDRYIVHILRRPKDISPKMKNELGANEAQRLIKTYYIDSIEYFDRKIPAIKEYWNPKKRTKNNIPNRP